MNECTLGSDDFIIHSARILSFVFVSSFSLESSIDDVQFLDSESERLLSILLYYCASCLSLYIYSSRFQKTKMKNGGAVSRENFFFFFFFFSPLSFQKKLSLIFFFNVKHERETETLSTQNRILCNRVIRSFNVMMGKYVCSMCANHNFFFKKSTKCR